MYAAQSGFWSGTRTFESTLPPPASNACENAVHQTGGRILIAETSGTPLYDGTRKFYFGMGYENEATIKDFYSMGDDLKIFTKRI